MRKRSKKKVAVVILFVVFMATQLLCALNIKAIEQSIPNGVKLFNANGVGISIAQALKFDDYKSNGILGAVSAEELNYISAEGRNMTAVYTAYATPQAGHLLPLRYTYGNWFLPRINGTESIAVIPESISLALFGTDMPISVSVCIMGTDYKVCGVYKENSDFLSKFSDDGVPRVYLSGSSQMADKQVATLYLADANGSNAQSLVLQASTILQTQLQGNMSDYRQQITLAHRLWYLSILVCIFFLAVLLLTSAERRIVFAHSMQGVGTQSVVNILIGMGVISTTMIGLMFFLDRLFIPALYLPKDNIFDFPHYGKQIMAFFQTLHTKGEQHYYDWFYIVNVLTMLFWAAIGIITFFSGTFKLWKLIDKCN